MISAWQFLKNDSPASRSTRNSLPLPMNGTAMQMCLPLAIPARSIPGPEATGNQSIPTSPDTALPWSEDFDLGGWSARMFLHQLLRTSRPAWKPSDTEQLLSEWTPLHIRGRAGNGITLSDYIKPADKVSADSFRTVRMVQGVIRRALERGRSFRLLLRTEHDTIPVIVTFGTRKQKDFAFWTVKSGKPLPDSLRAGLLAFLKRHMPEFTETA